MNAVKHFLGSYSDNFAAALVLWPVLSFMFTLPILAYLYHRDGRLRFGTFVGAYLTVLYVCGLGCFTPVSYTHLDVYKRQLRILLCATEDYVRTSP